MFPTADARSLLRALLVAVCAMTAAWSHAEVRAPVVASEHASGLSWAFQPLSRPAVPSIPVPDAVRSPVDAFITTRLRQAGLAFAPAADARTLVRRLYVDLIGLPPTPGQVAAFEVAHAQDPERALSGLVDELLASPHHGERWGRHWCDVARYADSDGQEGDADRLTAYPFRDFVIRAFNRDMPFDEFVRWQLAGDELQPDNPEAIAATGFIVAGPHAELPLNLMEEERTRTRFNELDDMLSTTSSAMLGLTMACARCHDHKYDPIPRTDYYRMLKAFNGGDRALAPLGPLRDAQRYRVEMTRWKTEWEEAKKARDASGKDSARKEAADRVLKEIESRKPAPMAEALAFADFDSTPRETHLLARGDFRAKVEPVELGFIEALTRGRTPADYWRQARDRALRNDSTQQRRALAEWMTDVDHGAGALVARVIVNRVWQHHFGEGLVRTVNDFGARSDPPTHPELLEWLASEFVRGGWRLKTLHRLILNSTAWRQGSGFDAVKARLDPDNRLLSRQRPRRVESEVLRDSMLATAGVLNDRMFGPAVKAPIAPEAIQARNLKSAYPKDLKDSHETQRRSVYLFHKRVVQLPLLQAFDGPDALMSCGRRETTTVAPQALALLNDPFVRARAEDFARRLMLETGDQLRAQVQRAWQIALARAPRPREIEMAEAFIQAQYVRRVTRSSDAPDQAEAHQQALADFCQSLFGLNEFIYVD